MDLSYTDELMRDKYSKFGPTPRTPSCMQHSYLLSIGFKVASITDWAAQLKINPLYAILSGFEVGNTPGVGTLIVTSHRMRSSRICCCHKIGISKCSCDRYFSQPDCDIGWDSSRDCWYHGYDLYMLVASDSESDLPVFPLLNPASKHDSHGFLETFFRMKSFIPDFIVTKLFLDSAHDAMPIYEYCKQENITLFIDLNEKRGIKVKYKNDFTIGKDGVPVCKEGYRMNHDGCEPSKLDAHLQAENTAVPANIPALIQSMAERFILPRRIIQG